MLPVSRTRRDATRRTQPPSRDGRPRTVAPEVSEGLAPPDRARGRRVADRVVWEPHADRRRPHREPERRVHHHRLAVEPELYRRRRRHVERRRRPRHEPLESLRMPGRERRDERRRAALFAQARARRCRGGRCRGGAGCPSRAKVSPYGLFETWITCAPSCRSPSPSVNRRSNGSVSGPSTCGSVVRVVSTLASRYCGRAHDRGVQTERHVVDEHVTVDVGEVEPALDRVAVGVQRPDDVVAVEPEVEREVVPCAGGDDHHRQPELGGDGADHGLRAVAARHAEHVDAARGHVAHPLEPVLTRLEHDRFDPSAAAFVDEVEPLRLAAARLEVHEQDAALARAGRECPRHRRP